MKTIAALFSSLAGVFLLSASPLNADISEGKPHPQPTPEGKELKISVSVQSLIPNYDKALTSPVPRLLELVYIVDQNLIDYVGNYFCSEVTKAYGIDALKDNMRDWYIELYKHRGLERIVVEKISFEANRSTVHYRIVMKDGESEGESTDFILDENGQWFLNDKDL